MRTEKFPRLKAINVVSRVLASRWAFDPLDTAAAWFLPLALTPVFETTDFKGPFDFEPRVRAPFSEVTLFIIQAPYNSKIPYGHFWLWQSLRKTQPFTSRYNKICCHCIAP